MLFDNRRTPEEINVEGNVIINKLIGITLIIISVAVYIILLH